MKDSAATPGQMYFDLVMVNQQPSPPLL